MAYKLANVSPLGRLRTAVMHGARFQQHAAVMASCRRNRVLSCCRGGGAAAAAAAAAMNSFYPAATAHLSRSIGTATQSMSGSLAAEDDRDAVGRRESVTDVVTRLYSVKRFHKAQTSTDTPSVRASLEQQAWKLLQDIPEEQIGALSAADLTEVLSAWVYFSQFWDRGLDGPSVLARGAGGTREEGGGAAPWTASSGTDHTKHTTASAVEEEDVSYPLLTRRGGRPQGQSRGSCLDAADAPPPRASPLDEVLEF